MKYYLTVIFFIKVSLSFSQTEIDPYVEFFNKQKPTPKDYIFELFKTNDIVILGERDHRDITQYDLIFDILSDPRFINHIGHVYTEVGVVNRTKWANEVLKGKYKNEKAFEKELVKLYRELDWNELWDKYNMVKHLTGIYKINKSLSEKKKITVGLTDCAFDWNDMTHEKYVEFAKTNLYTYNARDSVMAYNFISLYENQKSLQGQKKALLIQSRPHAITLNTTNERVRIKTAGYYIKEKYGEKVKVVAFNWYNWVPEEWNSKYFGKDHIIELSANGKWDAAYELSGKPTIGFNVKDTPFGQEKFDYLYDEEIKYQDIIDGFIFYLPFYEFKCSRGLPGIVDRKFAKELLKRNDIRNGDTSYSDKWSVRDEISDWEEFRIFDCNDYKKMKEQMNKWIKK
jgi:hypothetical protein